jgi:hypothetical protein
MEAMENNEFEFDEDTEQPYVVGTAPLKMDTLSAVEKFLTLLTLRQ